VLDRAQLQETSFSPAVLDLAPPQKSSLSAAVTPPDTQDVTAKLSAAPRLPNSSLQGAQMYRGFLDGVNLEGADLKVAQLEEASLTGSNLRGAGLRDAKLDNARLQGASLVIIEVKYPREEPMFIAANDREISDFIARSLEDVLDKSNVAVNFSKAGLQADLRSRLSLRASADRAGMEKLRKRIRSPHVGALSKIGRKHLQTCVLLVRYQFVRERCSDQREYGSSQHVVLRTQGSSGRQDVRRVAPEGGREECPYAKTLTESTREQLQHVINPRRVTNAG
jgi:hypothetical protein